jgi:hypothetical protein
MESKWKRCRILIWGKTRPELSKKYREIVCTGGVFQNTKKLVRLYPIPLRYMDDEQVFKKYQWIEADVTKARNDPRPESYKIHPDNIETFGMIPSKGGNWDARAEWIMNEHNIFRSVEALKDKQQKDNTSLGLVKPLEVVEISAHPHSQKEKAEFWQRYKDTISQMEISLEPETQREIKPLTPSEYRFKISFRCDDKSCQTEHNFSVLDWELDALYSNLRKKGNAPELAANKVVEKLREEICAPEKDLFFFLGNIATHPNIFTIVGLWWPKKSRTSNQLKLL